MFITNPSSLSSLSNIFKTKSKTVNNYLIKNNIPLLSQDESGFYFSDTNNLKQIIDNAPFWIKILCREEVKN